MKRTRNWAPGAFALVVFALGIFGVLPQPMAEEGYYKGKTMKLPAPRGGVSFRTTSAARNFCAVFPALAS